MLLGGGGSGEGRGGALPVPFPADWLDGCLSFISESPARIRCPLMEAGVAACQGPVTSWRPAEVNSIASPSSKPPLRPVALGSPTCDI